MSIVSKIYDTFSALESDVISIFVLKMLRLTLKWVSRMGVSFDALENIWDIIYLASTVAITEQFSKYIYQLNAVKPCS